MQSGVAAEIQNTGLTPNRRLRDLREIASQLTDSKLKPLQFCEAIIEDRLVNLRIRQFFSGLPEDEKTLLDFEPLCHFNAERPTEASSSLFYTTTPSPVRN